MKVKYDGYEYICEVDGEYIITTEVDEVIKLFLVNLMLTTGGTVNIYDDGLKFKLNNNGEVVFVQLHNQVK